jgi:hypothetical protein
MAKEVHPPAASPCGSCPYRRDVPSGIWSVDEYAKLPAYDAPTGEQPIGVFHCHRQDGRVCAGWAGCHDMQESLAVRIAALDGRLDADELLDYETTTPLFDSGAEAALHGMKDIADPGPEARRVMEKLRAQFGG